MTPSSEEVLGAAANSAAMNRAPASPLRIAFVDIVNPGWTAGAHYYTNLFKALQHLDDKRRPYIVVVVAPHQRTAGYDTYRELADEVLELPTSRPASVARRAIRRAKRSLGVGGPRTPIEMLLNERHVDALFACWMEFGPSFSIPSLGWITDFNHMRRPGTHPAEEERQRDRLFARMATNCSRIVLSSEDARRDFESFSPAFAHKARVLQFVAQVPAGVRDCDPAWICGEYHLPEKFVYLPNQFWVHKNHELVVDALELLQSSRGDVTVVCTGNPADNRDPLHFARLLSRVARRGLRDNFIVLGWTPHEHTFHLMRQAVAVLQPSLFEGWSTTVEEAKSVGKTIVLSDIPVHREQAPPRALYFDPTDAMGLAERLVEVYDTRLPGPDEELEATAAGALPERTQRYAADFVDVVMDARSH